jgi:hypothetical protein
VGGRLVSVLDADVLVPILSCDVLLCAFDHDLYRPVVTGGVLAEANAPSRPTSPAWTPLRWRE